MKTDVDLVLLSLQAGIYRRVLVNAVDSNGKCKINGLSNDMLKIQKVDGLALYDDLDLSFNSTDKAIILKLNDVDIVRSINHKAVSTDVYTKSDIDLRCSSLIGAAPSVLNTSVELATD